MNPRLTFRRVNWKWSLPGLVLVAILAAFFNPPDSGVTSGEFEYVQRVIDGGTLMLGTGERLRLIGVNMPETVHPKKAVEAFGKEASAFTKRMVEGKLVRLEFDPLSSQRNDGKDRYLRTLAYVFLEDGMHLNAEIIRQGYEKNIAIEYRFAEGKPDRLPDLAAELVRLKVDAIVAVGVRQRS